MSDVINEIEEDDDRPAALSYEELVERFRAKVAGIPEECHEAIMLWKMAKEDQQVRIAAENRMRQVVDIGKRVFWGDELPDSIRQTMLKGDAKYYDMLRKREDMLVRASEKAFKQTRWYNEVALPAAEGYGLGPLLAGEFLWIIGNATRFETFGKIVRYAGLDVQDGKSPKRRKGSKITWSPNLRTALFKLTDVWNRTPEGIWRARWDGYKAWYREKFPEKEVYEVNGKKKTRYNDGHIHNMARRKVQREFLRNLWTLWVEYEELTQPEGGEE